MSLGEEVQDAPCSFRVHRARARRWRKWLLRRAGECQDSAYWRIFWENSQACDKKVGESPPVDFLKHDVLLVLFGRAPHTGYFASLDSVVERRNLTMAFVSYRTDGCEVGFAAHFMNYGTVVPKWGKPIAWTIRVNDPPSWCRSGARR